MRKLITAGIVLAVFSVINLASAQDAHWGIGPANGSGQLLPAQGNSANVNYLLGKLPPEFIMSPGCAVSYDSRENTLSAGDIPRVGETITPLYAGTEILSADRSAPAAVPSGAGLVQFNWSMLLESRTYNYAWYMNYASADFLTLLTTLSIQGFRIESIDMYGKTVLNYAGTWTQDSKGWAYVLNYTSANLITTLTNWPIGTTRYRPIHLAANPGGSQMVYSAVAVQDNLGFGWIVNESNSSTFMTWIQNQFTANRRLADIQVSRDVAGNLLCAAITKDATFAQQIGINLSASSFSSLNTTYIGQGYRLLDVDKYCIAGVTYYAAVWNKDGIGYAYALDYANQSTFQSTVTNYINQGFKPIAIDVFDGDWIQGITPESRPNSFSLAQNYPNPFNPSTTIPYELAGRSFVTLRVYNMLGQEVAALVNGEQNAGPHEVRWNASRLPSGVYIYRLEAGGLSSARKLQILK